MADIPARLKLRTGTLAAWTSANPILAAGEPGYEVDTNILRIGNGTVAFLSLPRIRTTGIAGGTAPGDTVTFGQLSGMIVLWSGSILSIPDGWALCDGTNGTPNLRDRFVVGAGTTYAVGATGGAATVALSAGEMPVHAHGVGSLGMNAVGDHAHNYLQGANYIPVPNSGSVTYGYLDGGATGNQRGTSGAGNHAHTISGNTGNAGSGSAHENRPPYFALAYIMKL